MIPRNKIVCFIGVSGSGKSTVAFDIIAREGERQYFESLPSYARRYLHKSNRPDVDEIKGVSASIVISQDRVRGNPRSTVGTLTEAYTYLRLLYSRVGLPSMDSSYYSFNHPYGACKKCKGLGRSIEVNLNKLLDMEKSLNQGAIRHGDWRVKGMRWSIIRATNFFDMDLPLRDFREESLEKLLYAPKQLIEDTGDYKVIKWTFAGLITHIMTRDTNIHRGPTQTDLEYFDFIDCPACHGGRLNQEALAVKLNKLNIGQVANLSLDDCFSFVQSINHKNALAIKPLLEKQLKSLISVGVGYLSLNRSTNTLSGGEAQRVKMARQLSCDLIETIYVFDEPTAGLHPRDVNNINQYLNKLKNNNNSVIVVEHDEVIIKSADHIIELGPGGGKNGGRIIAQGTLREVINNRQSVTGKYLSRKSNLNKIRLSRRSNRSIKIVNAKRNNLKNLNLNLPLGELIALTGVSGSGKSSLVEEIYSQHNNIVLVDQSQIGANKRGCVATYVGVFDEIRKIFGRANNMSPSLFSFNSYGGCENCKGIGYIEMDMNFLGDVKIKCENCQGSRYKEKVLRYQYQGKNIAQVLMMTAEEIKDFFKQELIKQKMNFLIDVGLDYVEMGQTLDALSGGESQRLKLATRLEEKGNFYILDEPTSGLHFADIEKLMRLLNKLVDGSNTVLVIEHNLNVIAQADWIIDLGPEGGDKGGKIIVQGTPIAVSQNNNSYTGQFLKKILK
ncbi:daunorubicin resistance protein DrrC [Candidatus Roizmanbacteria bacterium CG03_land_8_20_14_0_80_36_21]|uniref:UvrABC system protein A n=2 Tax=Candidatus Roizmaniibacteriota TaxID=1752723 RepID=A0A2M8KLK4_9BACT|nr:MAG: daunorubicin resistance protein DrrC [Candidatus Roizmanbacteria bacterium CG03_land_8_20_14_0_80_36_21]PJA53022.1 MAG: daunorubicin resistance protein DrrC [Candidatus Roizmanbacteria bacterium CG_4_9_14_3_um_filter_36_11]PJE60809.1 MAG: daunorubicin resistance protein DrrC [Candidatus Roizmanbacteria bacterium CG10_big_fil_rev_8_21_14_0_10_36_26]